MGLRSSLDPDCTPSLCRRGLRRRPVLSFLPWASSRRTKAAVKLHTLLDLRGNIPTFVHISEGKLHDVHVLDLLPLEPGAFYIMDRGYLDFARLYRLALVGAPHPSQVQHPVPSSVFAPGGQEYGAQIRPDHHAYWCPNAALLSRKIAVYQVLRRHHRENLRLFDQQLLPAGIDHRRSLPLPLTRGAVFRLSCVWCGRKRQLPRSGCVLDRLNGRSTMWARGDRGIRRIKPNVLLLLSNRLMPMKGPTRKATLEKSRGP